MVSWITTGLLILGFISAPLVDESPETVTLRGEVVALPEVLAARGVSADRGPIAEQLVLREEDGTIVPLLPSPASRALWLDERLRSQPTEIQTWRYEGLPYAQVIRFKVADESGTYRTPEYYCDICTIHVRYPQDCPCCQAEMELRFKP